MIAPGHFGTLLMTAAFLLPHRAAAAADAAVLGEVVVTARKIEENVQHVPMSVQVLDTDFLADADLSHVYELQFVIPGLVVNNVGMFGAGFSLRGVADQAGGGSAVATHVNGVYLGDAQLAISRMFDIGRIEVLKGPQGTLYGQNSTGGSINLITRPPEAGPLADIEAAYGSFSTTRVQGHVDVPIANASVGLAFAASEGDGYIRNSVDGREFAESDYRGLRASARIGLGRDGRVDIVAQHVEDDGASGELWTPNPQFLANPRDIRLATVTLDDPFLELESSLVTVNLSYDFGAATLVSISGYARNGVRDRDDCAGEPFLQGCVRGERDGRYRQWSEELQLRLPGSGRVDGLVGVYYFASDLDSRFYQLVPLVNPNPLNDARQTASDTAAALFGQATLQLTGQWSLTGGLRLGRDERRVTTVGSGVADSPTKLAGRRDSGGDAWRFDVAYAASEDLRFYASVATGYTSGGFTRQVRSGQLDDFGPEEILAYEAGVKSRSPRRRLTLNAATFLYDYRDVQVSTTELVEGQPFTGVDNAAKAKLYGIDAEASLQATDRIGLSAGAVWMPKREFTEFTDEQTGRVYSGNRLVRAPRLSSTVAIEYAGPLRGLGSLSARIEYNYRSAYFFTRDNVPKYAQDAFGLLNAFVTLALPEGRWQLFAAARNLTDEDYFNQVFLQSSPGLPSTWEIGAGCRF